LLLGLLVFSGVFLWVPYQLVLVGLTAAAAARPGSVRTAGIAWLCDLGAALMAVLAIADSSPDDDGLMSVQFGVLGFLTGWAALGLLVVSVVLIVKSQKRRPDQQPPAAWS
jgi:hypothetical protein